MSLVNIPTFSELSEEGQNKYNEEIARKGHISNMKKILLHYPLALDTLSLKSWYPTFDELVKQIGERASVFFAHAISNQNKCILCNTFFVKIFRDWNIDINTYRFTDDEKLLINYGRAIASDPHKIPSEITDKLQKSYSQSLIVLLTAFATLMIATNTFNTVIGVPVDEELQDYVEYFK